MVETNVAESTKVTKYSIEGEAVIAGLLLPTRAIARRLSDEGVMEKNTFVPVSMTFSVEDGTRDAVYSKLVFFDANGATYSFSLNQKLDTVHIYDSRGVGAGSNQRRDALGSNFNSYYGEMQVLGQLALDSGSAVETAELPE